MSSYYGLSIMILWIFSFITLFLISENPFILFFGAILGLPIAFLSAKLDTIIESKQEEK